MASQNLGTLFVTLNAESKNFLSGMASATQAIDKFAKETKKLANDVAGAAGMMLAIGGAAVKLAASVDSRAAKSMENLEKQTKLVAIQVFDVLKPAVDSLASTFHSAADAIAGMDPETKKAIATWAIWIAQLAVAAKVLGTASSLIGGVAGALSSLFKIMATVGAGPLLGIVAAIAAVVAIVIFLHRAWRKNWGDIQGITESVFKNLGKAVSWLADLFGGMWKVLIAGASVAVDTILNVVDSVQKLTGKNLIDTAGLREGFHGMFKDMQTGDFLGGALSFAKDVATQTGEAVTEEVGIIKAEIMKALGISGGGGGGGSARGPARAVSGFANRFGNITDDPRTMHARDIMNSVGGSAAKVDALGGFGGGRSEAAQDAKKAQYALLVEQKEQAKRLADKTRATGKAIANILTSSTGALGAMISNIATAAKDGGPWAAMLAAIMEVVQRMASFQKLMKIWEYGLVRLGQMLEPLLSTIFDLVGTFTALGTEMLGPIFKALKPLFDGITSVLMNLVPVMMDIGALFESLAPIINAIATIIGKVLEALKPLFVLIGGIIKIIVSIVNGILIVLNGIAAAFGDQAAKAEVDRIAQATKDMWDKTPEQQMAEAAQIDSTWQVAAANNEAAASAKSVAESLTNMPSGYKIAQARFDTTMPDYGSVGGSMGGTNSTGGNTTNINGDVNVNTDAKTAEELAEAMKKAAERRRARETGNPGGSDGRWGDN